jgi:hypothetical protein
MLDCGSIPLWYSVEMRKITDVMKEFSARYFIREYEMSVIITIFAWCFHTDIHEESFDFTPRATS